MNMFRVIILFFTAIFILFEALILNYLFKLEKIGCKCALDWRRNYVMGFMVIIILYSLALFVFDYAPNPLIQTCILFIIILNAVFSLQYVYKLKKEKCDCSDNIYRYMLFIISIFHVLIYSFTIFLIVFYFYTMASFMRNRSNFKPKKVMSVKPLIRKPKLI